MYAPFDSGDLGKCVRGAESRDGTDRPVYDELGQEFPGCAYASTGDYGEREKEAGRREADRPENTAHRRYLLRTCTGSGVFASTDRPGLYNGRERRLYYGDVHTDRSGNGGYL
jgi:hypothetical protein